MNTNRGPQRIDASLEKLLGNLNAPSVDVLDVIFRAWGSIVGPDLAEHTRPGSIDGDLLTVTADDPTWAAEFRWLEGGGGAPRRSDRKRSNPPPSRARFAGLLRGLTATNHTPVTGKIRGPCSALSTSAM